MIRLLLTGMVLFPILLSGKGPFELITTIPMPAERFQTDIMGQVYWSEGSTLFRYNPANDQKTEYSNAFLGEIHSWDASNPLKILVFHKQFNSIVFLDKHLTPIRSPVKLDQLGVSMVSNCCLSHRGGFWLINRASGQIQRYNTSLMPSESTEIIPEFNASYEDPPVIREHNRRLYCLIPGCCAMIFDRFGNLARRQPLKNVDNIQMLNQNIYYFYNGDLYRMDKDFRNAEEVKLPQVKGKWDFARIGAQNTLFLLKNRKLYIYKS
jgi:hypothetical protein